MAACGHIGRGHIQLEGVPKEARQAQQLEAARKARERRVDASEGIREGKEHDICGKDGNYVDREPSIQIALHAGPRVKLQAPQACCLVLLEEAWACRAFCEVVQQTPRMCLNLTNLLKLNTDMPEVYAGPVLHMHVPACQTQIAG